MGNVCLALESEMVTMEPPSPLNNADRVATVVREVGPAVSALCSGSEKCFRSNRFKSGLKALFR